MTKLFLKEHKGNILFFAFIVVWVAFLLIIDKGFAGVSTLYLITTLLFFGIIFFVTNFVKEKRKLHQFSTENNFQEYKNYFDLYEKKQAEWKENMEHFQNQLAVHTLEEKDEQLAWVHEMKTPLTAIQLLLEQLPSSKEKRALQVEWTRTHLLLDQTLHTLRLEEIEQDTLPEKTTLKELVLSEIKELQSWCISKGIQLEIDNVEYPVIIDKKWAKFIIRQILSNAIKYSEENG